MGKNQKKGGNAMAGWTPRKIKAALMLRGVRQKDIALEVGVDASMVSLVIKAERVSRRVRAAIAAALGKKVRDIWPAA
jgi:lambda repressor-like predicted transcriptional regulator